MFVESAWSPSWRSTTRRTLAVLSVAALMPVLASRAAWQEAPMLRERVASGELPPVEERLPEVPAVVEPLHEVGLYGGTWRRLAITPQDSLMNNRLGYEPLIRWDRTGRHPTPNVASEWRIEDEGRRYVLALRKGIRWSDGHPFTSEDILFWFEDVEGTVQTSVGEVHIAPRDTQLTVSAPDPYTVVFQFDKPNGIFLEKLCYVGHWIYLPKHYLRQFHIKYADPAALQRMIAAGRYNHWSQLFQEKSDLCSNTECPTIRPWRITVGPPATTYVVERNPYYWKVDPEGNQLPYIDRIAFRVVESAEVLNLIACTGGVDMQGRHIDPSKYTLFMLPENRNKDGITRYRVLRDPGPGANVGMRFNLSTQNPRLRPYITDRRFRIAMSVAINREEVVELIENGAGQPINGVGYPFDRYFTDGVDKQHTQHDPALAQQLLDAVGLKRGSDGMRRYPDGAPFREILYCITAGMAGELQLEQLVVDYWREVGLEFVIKSEPTDMGYSRGRNGNFDFIFMGQAGFHWVLQPALYVPIEDTCYSAPGYGRYVQSGGTAGVPPPPEFQRLIDGYYALVHTVGDDARQLDLGRKILQQWGEECYMIGVYRQDVLAIVSNRFRNCPDHILHCWRVQFPGYMQPEQFYLESRERLVRAEAGPSGSIFPDGEFRVYHGSAQDFRITPDRGYAVSDVRVNGRSVGAVTAYTAERVTGPLDIRATFVREASQ